MEARTLEELDRAQRSTGGWAADCGRRPAVAIEKRVIGRLRKSLPLDKTMDASIISVISGLVGTLLGGSASVATAWVTQRTFNKRELIRVEMSKRETLYGDFIGECSRLLVDALTHTLEKPETLLGAYALLNRIRLCASEAVLSEGERLLRRITDQYFSNNLTLDNVHSIMRSDDADPLLAFGEACRAELRSMRAGV